MTGGFCMRAINSLFFVLFLLFPYIIHAQDKKPDNLEPESPLVFNNERPWSFKYVDQIYVDDSILNKFSGVCDNVLCDPEGTLDSFYDKMYEQLLEKDCVVRIVHIGDSHVRGHFFPGEVKFNMEKLLGCGVVHDDNYVFNYSSSGISEESGTSGVVYQVFGINGATAQTFCNPEYIMKIASLKPDLIIISFGTNESHVRKYNGTQNKNQLDLLVNMLKSYCKNVPFLLTTPPGSYIKYRGRYRINENTEHVSEVIRQYASENNIAYWDLYSIVGGRKYACSNWLNNGYMQRDKIHFTRQGYELMGNLLYNAIIKLFNKYVGD